jgi:hypothetical protein
MAHRKDFDDSKYYEEEGYSKPKRKKTFRKKEKYKNSYLDELDDYNHYETKKGRTHR